MLSRNQVINLVDYWVESSKEKLKTMKSLYKDQRYVDCLFFGHLVLEKILKALVVKETKNAAPYIHSLLKLAKIAKIELTKDDTEVLRIIDTFNIEARYSDESLSFYKLTTKSYTDRYYYFILCLHKKLLQRLN